MEELVSGRVAVITGGGNGIGRSIAKLFAEEGAIVVVADIDVDGGEQTVDQIRKSGGTAEFVETNVTILSEVQSLMEATFDEFGSLDILVSNAGGSAGDDKLHLLDQETWNQMIDLNLTNHFYCARSALPHMIETGGGALVFMSSVNAVTGIGLASYSAAKSGVIGLSKVIAAHYGRHGVRSNVLCPGTIQSKNLAAKRESQWSEDRWDGWINQYPIGRFGRPGEVANSALFLASDQSSFMTGQELILDGGLTASLDHNLLNLMYDIDEPPSL